MARVLIAGCGDVGTRLGLALAADGDEVRGLRRNPAALPPALHGVRGDLTTGDGLRAAADGVQILVYAAAADGFTDEAYRSAYVDGLARVLDALAAVHAPLERVLFTSSTAVYGQSDGSWVDEDSPTEPQGFSGRRLLEAERLLLACGRPAAVLRLAGIYGPGRTRLIEEVRGGAATVPADGAPLWTNRVHADDCAGALRHLLRSTPDEMAGVWVGVDDEPCDRAVVLDWLADRLGVARPRRVAAGDAAVRTRPGNKRCSNARLKRAGYVFRFPTFREGYADVLARLGTQRA
jgi:nucleoside-diphosphate-sugar epimerase